MASSRPSLAKADSKISPIFKPFGVGFSKAWFQGVGFLDKRWAGTKLSLSKQRMYLGA